MGPPDWSTAQLGHAEMPPLPSEIKSFTGPATSSIGTSGSTRSLVESCVGAQDAASGPFGGSSNVGGLLFHSGAALACHWSISSRTSWRSRPCRAPAPAASPTSSSLTSGPYASGCIEEGDAAIHAAPKESDHLAADRPGTVYTCHAMQPDQRRKPAGPARASAFASFCPPSARRSARISFVFVVYRSTTGRAQGDRVETGTGSTSTRKATGGTLKVNG